MVTGLDEGTVWTLRSTRPKVLAQAEADRAAAERSQAVLDNLDALLRSLGFDPSLDPGPNDVSEIRSAPVVSPQRMLPAQKRRSNRNPRPGSGAEYALEVLRSAEGPLTAREIFERVTAAGWETSAGASLDTLRKSLRRRVRQGVLAYDGKLYAIAPGGVPEEAG